MIFFNDNPLVLAIMSYVPFSAPVGMPMRLFLGDAQWWEPLASLALLLVTTVAVIALGSRIYSNSLLRTGSRVTLKDALGTLTRAAAAIDNRADSAEDHGWRFPWRSCRWPSTPTTSTVRPHSTKCCSAARRPAVSSRGCSSSTSDVPGCCSNAPPHPPSIYFEVDDVHATVGRLRAGGVQVVGEPQLIFSHTDDTLGPAGNDEWMAFILDSEGEHGGTRQLRAPARSLIAASRSGLVPLARGRLKR